ncbi:MAG: hypothetical protein MHM6MM_002979 [Cercozoa sp. M6MM]
MTLLGALKRKTSALVGRHNTRNELSALGLRLWYDASGSDKSESSGEVGGTIWALSPSRTRVSFSHTLQTLCKFVRREEHILLIDVNKTMPVLEFKARCQYLPFGKAHESLEVLQRLATTTLQWLRASSRNLVVVAVEDAPLHLYPGTPLDTAKWHTSAASIVGAGLLSACSESTAQDAFLQLSKRKASLWRRIVRASSMTADAPSQRERRPRSMSARALWVGSATLPSVRRFCSDFDALLAQAEECQSAVGSASAKDAVLLHSIEMRHMPNVKARKGTRLLLTLTDTGKNHFVFSSLQHGALRYLMLNKPRKPRSVHYYGSSVFVNVKKKVSASSELQLRAYHVPKRASSQRPRRPLFVCRLASALMAPLPDKELDLMYPQESPVSGPSETAEVPLPNTEGQPSNEDDDASVADSSSLTVESDKAEESLIVDEESDSEDDACMRQDFPVPLHRVLGVITFTKDELDHALLQRLSGSVQPLYHDDMLVRFWFTTPPLAAEAVDVVGLSGGGQAGG